MDHICTQSQFGEDWFTYPQLYTYFVNNLSDGAKIVEVGSWKGKSTAYLGVEIINSGKDIKVDAVDTWLGTPDESYHLQDTYVRTGTLYNLFCSNIAPVSSVVRPVRMTSLEASKTYPDGSLDVVFIDAGHSYESVKEDIAAWFPKVKPGGWISGHDFPAEGVQKAVTEFFSDKLEHVRQGEQCWLYQKPL